MSTIGHKSSTFDIQLALSTTGQTIALGNHQLQLAAANFRDPVIRIGRGRTG